MGEETGMTADDSYSQIMDSALDFWNVFIIKDFLLSALLRFVINSSILQFLFKLWFMF